MSRPRLEVADIFRARGADWRQAHQGHISLGQLKVMSAIETCRSATLGGHVLQCTQCHQQQIAYNSCRNRHCPKCQASTAERWLEQQQAHLLPVAYYHLVFTLPQPIADLAYGNKSMMYAILFQSAAETLNAIAADPRHLGARIGFTLVLHSWGSAMTHHPHVHGIVTGGGLSLDGQRWVNSKTGFFLPVRVLSRLFRRLFLERLHAAHRTGELKYFGELEYLRETNAFAQWLKPLKKLDWVVYAKRSFAGPEAVLTYLSRYTHRVAISNRRLVSFDGDTVRFRWKDYRSKKRHPFKTMALDSNEFIRRFLIHVLPKGFHRIRHYGFLANSGRQAQLEQARALLQARQPEDKAPEKGAEDNANSSADVKESPLKPTYVCTHCGQPMIVIDTLSPNRLPRAPPGTLP